MSTANLDGADLAAVNLGGLINEDVMQQIFDISDIRYPSQIVSARAHTRTVMPSGQWTAWPSPT